MKYKMSEVSKTSNRYSILVIPNKAMHHEERLFAIRNEYPTQQKHILNVSENVRREIWNMREI